MIISNVRDCRNIESIELIEMNNNIYCCICLNTNVNNQNYDFVKMNCCNQQIHKNCFLDWILYPIKKNNNYDKKFHCIICKTKIINLQNIISIGDFINYFEKNCTLQTNEDVIRRQGISCRLMTSSLEVSHYKTIISEFYKDSIVTIIINSEDDTNEHLNNELKFCFCNLFCIIFFFISLIILMIIINVFVKK